MFTIQPIQQPPQADLWAAAAMTRVLSAIAERVNFHAVSFADFWGPGMTPDERLAALNAHLITLDNGQQAPASGIYLQFASENLRDLSTIAAIIGLELSDLIPTLSYAPPREFIPHPDGTVTLAPPAEGFDAWGRPIPQPIEEPLDTPEVQP